MGGILVEKRAQALALRVLTMIFLFRGFHDMEITGEDDLKHLKDLAPHDTSVCRCAVEMYETPTCLE